MKTKKSAALPLLDFAASKAARDEALQRVTAHAGTEFMKVGLEAIARLPIGDVTGEHIRVTLIGKNIRPHHPNAWGALVRSAVKLGLLIETGLYTKMTDVRSHARRTAIYRLARP